ncbi:endolytic transglycosylase MltG [Fonticella tunisiensis]|uniref:Endolytic murein transglycosylase n=1 Tax=Fonticella tunisiensis TaxID=1096341 RepID=A0A4R7KS17_9CLOT|nr:endolytic transglycosylase MltG [Fonticella tunisiensis]TDT58463.1 UPF0755 protein [Fonticella tunisiensis]
MKRIIIFISLLFILAIIASTSIHIIRRYSQTINTGSVYLVIKEGQSLEDISKILLDRKVIRSSRYFIYYGKIKGFDKKIKPGNYILSPGLKVEGIFKKFQSGISDFEIVTIPEGFTLYQIASRLEERNLVKKDSFINIKLDEIDRRKLITPGKGVYYEAEGFLFPDTYYVPKDLSEKEIAELMFHRFESVFSEKYGQRAKELGLSINDVVTIASLIEREAANDEERKRISGVIYNRIKREMPLQIDASVIYAITKGERNIGRLYKSNLKFESKYNTYLYRGLPPGPIASPGRLSIEAALYPEEHDYLYYVLGNNGHVFSRTYEEHVKNVNKYIK